MSFHSVQLPKTIFTCEPYTKSQLQKWDLLQHMKLYMLTYSRYYHHMQSQELTLDLFNDPSIQQNFQVLLKAGEWGPLKAQVTAVSTEVIPATLTRLDLFDKLLEAPVAIVRSNGDIAKCFEDAHQGFQVSDMLRDLLLNQDSENADLYQEEETSEFLWRIFEHLCLGGPCCQYEDKLQPYLDAAKKIYKDLLSVQKDPVSGKIKVASTVYRVTGITTETGDTHLFPAQSRNNFCYVVVDPQRRTCKIWYHAFLPFW